ncbi:hypothetical protein P8452_20078 [Trifolium repens]|nr:hypothetical protein P8452_20078 [Trifolium repens]
MVGEIAKKQNKFSIKINNGRNEDGSDQNQVTNILDPVKTRSKGRPPEQRKISKVDQIVKKVARKRTQKSSQKSENCQAQKKGMCASRVQESVRVIDRVGTRKTIQGEQSIFGRNEQGGVNQLAPFNPNTILISKVNQVPFYSQVMNHGGGSYFELLQAQHHNWSCLVRFKLGMGLQFVSATIVEVLAFSIFLTVELGCVVSWLSV